jgi:hypothetical protein
MKISRTAMAAPESQFTTMRIRSMRYASGSAADDGAGVDMGSPPVYIEYQ